MSLFGGLKFLDLILYEPSENKIIIRANELKQLDHRPTSIVHSFLDAIASLDMGYERE